MTQYQLFDALTPDEYAALKVNIRQHGVLVPVEFDEDGNILDGHHRVKAWRELRNEGIELPDYPTITRSGMSENEKRNHVRALNLLRRHLSREQRATVFADMRAEGMTLQAIASAVGVDASTVKRNLDNSTFAFAKVDIPTQIVGADGKTRPTSYQKHQPASVGYADDIDDALEYQPSLDEYPSREIDTDTGEYLDVEPYEEDYPLPATNGKPHVAFNSGQNEWYTPSEYIEAARRTMGSIDLDPATSEIANQIVCAGQIFTASDNGLSREWGGNIWLNPPYSQPEISQFADKVTSEFWRIGQICVLVNNATETAWFQTLLSVATSICLVRGRVKFLDTSLKPNGAPLQGQVVLYAGDNADAFAREFKPYGAILDVR